MRSSETKVKRVKLQSRIPLTTRYRLVKVAEALSISGTQAICNLIDEEYNKVFNKSIKGSEE